MAQVSGQVKQLVTKTPRRSSSSTLEVLTEGQTPGTGGLHNDATLSFNRDWKNDMTSEEGSHDFPEELVDSGFRRPDLNVRMSMSWRNDLDGEETLVNEPVIPPSYESDSTESFEEESLASDSKIESDSGSESESENEIKRRTIPLGHDITADVPTEWTGKPCRLVPWHSADRSDKLHTISLGNLDSLISDIYETDNGCVFEACPFDAIVKIPVELQTGRLAPEVLYDFIVKIKDGKYWRNVPAEYKDGYVCILVERMEGLTAAARLKPEYGIVSPVGYLFVSDKDIHVQVEFPVGAVETDTEFQFLLESVDPERLREYKRYNPQAFSSILGFTSTLCVRHKMAHHLKRDVQVQLPIDDEQQDDDFDILFLRWEGDDVEVLDDIPSEKDQGIYSIAVDHFSDYSSVRVRHGAEARRIAEEAKYASGRINLCTLLTFITFEHVRNSPTILVDCVLSPRVNEVVEEQKKQGLKEIKLSRSRDLPVANHEKIRIDFAGNLTFAPGIPKNHYNLTFLTVAKANFITFPAFLRLSMGTYYSIINFRNEGKDWVHSIHFDLNIGPQNFRNLNRNPTFVCQREKTFAGISKKQTENETDPGKIRDAPMTPGYQSTSRNITPKLTGNPIPPNTRGSTKTPSVKVNDKNIPAQCKVQTPRTGDGLRHSSGREILKDFEARKQHQSTTLSSGWVDPGLKFTKDGDAIPSTSGLDLEVQPKTPGVQKRHPILSEKSLSALAEKSLPWSECQRVARELEILQDQMERIYEEATRKQTDPSLKIMLYWVSLNRSRKDSDLVNDLVAAFREIGRNDVAEVILDVQREQRPLRRSDFVS